MENFSIAAHWVTTALTERSGAVQCLANPVPLNDQAEATRTISFTSAHATTFSPWPWQR